MSTDHDLLRELAERGIELRANGDRLQYKPRDAVAPDLMERMRTHKAELLRIIADTPADAQGPSVANAATGGGRVTRPDVPHEPSLDERIESGYVNPGWRADDWRDRLRQLAGRCEVDHPDVAAQYRRWANNIILPIDKLPD